MHFWSAQLTRRPLLSILLFFALINLWLTSILYSRYGSTRYSFFFGKRSDDLAKLSVNHLESLKRSQMMFKELMENHTLIDQAAVDRQLIYNALLDYNEMLFVDVTDEDRTSWREIQEKMKRKLESIGEMTTKKAERRKFCVALSSVRRPVVSSGYLYQTMLSILSALSVEERKKTHLFLFNGELNPSDHKIALDVEQIVPTFSRDDFCPSFSNCHGLRSNQTLPYLRDVNSAHKSLPRQKDIFDYAILSRMTQRLCDYAILIEDDSLASPHFISKLEKRALNELEKTRGTNWLTMRLWATDFHEGWGNELFFQMLIFVLVSAYILTSIQLTLMHILKILFIRTPTYQSLSTSIVNAIFWLRASPHEMYIRHNSNSIDLKENQHVGGSSIFAFKWLLFILWIPTIIWFLYGIGRQNLISSYSSGLHFHNDHQIPGGCTAVALVLPTANLGNLTHHMTLYSWKHKDCLMDDYGIESGLPLLHLVPHLFQHMGAFSSFNVNGTMPDWKLFKTSSLFDTTDGYG